MEEGYPADERTKRLARTVGHDFNNLLSGIIGAISLAQEDLPETSRIRSRLEKAVLAARRATLLAHQLLSLSGSRCAPASLESIDVNEVLLRNRRLFEASLPGGSVLIYELSPDLPHALATVSDLQGIGVGLLSNAGESLEGGSGVIALRTGLSEKRVDGQEPDNGRLIRSLPDPDPVRRERCALWFEIEDSGPGIPPEVLQRIPEPLLSTRSDRRGLGLHFVHTLVSALGGWIRIRSSPGGTSVRVFIRRAGTTGQDHREEEDHASKRQPRAENS